MLPRCCTRTSSWLLAVVGVALILAVVAAMGEEEDQRRDLGRGFGDNYAWHTLEDGLRVAKESNLPAMIVIHKSWCGACKRLGPLFAASSSIQELASKFVMINVQDDEEPGAAEYKPDGGYIPRILFATPDGTIHPEISNEKGNRKYKYYYADDAQITDAMKVALSSLKATASEEKTEL